MPPSSDSKEAVHQTYRSKEKSWAEKKSQAESSDKGTPATGHWYCNPATKGRGTGRPSEGEGQNDTAGANTAETECVLCRGLALIGEQGGCLLAGSISQLCWLLPASQKEKIKEGFIHSCYSSKLSLNPSRCAVWNLSVLTMDWSNLV